ncbi:MAG: ABC transporter permease [Oscillospiraceae bacterium]|nr:ABC transporter permease [Oscillospiraceae bacterium]
MKNVFQFTLSQQLKKKSFTVTTVLIAVILFVLSAGTITAVDLIRSPEEKSQIDYVYVLDESRIGCDDYNIVAQSDNVLYKDVEFINAQGSVEECAEQAAKKSPNAVVMYVSDDKEAISIKMIIPEESQIEKKMAKNLGNYVSSNMKFVYYDKLGLDDSQVSELLRKTDSSVVEIGGEEKGIEETIIKMAAPAAMSFILYIMLAFYGQLIGQCLVLEKNSKLIENLLIMVKPNDVIFGKLIAVCLCAVMQFMFWIVSLTAGITTGVLISKSMSSAADSAGQIISDVLEKFAQAGSFSPLAIVLAVISLVLGFVFFSALAGLFGSFANKSEEVPEAIGTYMMCVVFGWIFSYMCSLNGSVSTLRTLRLIPISSPFIVPADILIGNMSVGSCLLSIGILLISSIIVIALASKVYFVLVLYRGSKLKFKDVFRMIKSDK